MQGLIFLLGFFWVGLCLAQDYFPPPRSQGGWRKNTKVDFVRSLGFDKFALDELVHFNIFKWDAFSCIIIKNGWIIAEGYDLESRVNERTRIYSNGKAYSIVTFGALLKNRGKGVIPSDISMDSKVYNQKWLPEGFPLSDPRKNRITFRHIFSHSSGIIPEREGPSQAPSPYVLNTVGQADSAFGRLYFDPGHPEQYAKKDPYSSIAFDHMSIVLRNLTDEKARDYLDQKIMQPIGARDYFAATIDDYWATDGHIYTTARDYARFAYFLLHDGKWKEQQILPPDFIPQFRTNSRHANLRGNTDGRFGKNAPKDLFAIGGYGWNRAFIFPSLDLVAVRTGMYTTWPWPDSNFVSNLLDANRFPVSKESSKKAQN